MPTDENSLPVDELYPFEDEPEDEAQRSAERPEGRGEGPTEREVRIPTGAERIAAPREDEPEGGAGDSDIERGTR